MTQLKLVWYNVLRGFHWKENGVFRFEPERLEAAKKVIRSLNPDILFIGEGDFNPKCKIKGEKIQTIDYQKEFDYPFVYYSEPDETSRKGEVILSKFNIKTKNYSSGKNTPIRTFFEVGGEKITADVIHPYPSVPEDEKAKFVEKVIGKRKERHLLLGDFNALSTKDKYHSEDLIMEFNLFHKNLEKATEDARESLRGLMVKKVVDSGLLDSYYECNKEYQGTLPTKRYTPKNGKSGAMRIDYIFCSKEFKVIQSGIVKNKETEIASDHYPIYATLVF